MLATIISSLGIDSTLFVQLGVYLVAYVILYNLVFKPYFLASEERRKMTVGNADSVKRSAELIQIAEEKFQKRARQINEEVSFLFNDQRSAASREIELVNKEAQEKTKALANETQQQIKLQLEQASSALTQSVDDVSKVIVQQILNGRGRTQ